MKCLCTLCTPVYFDLVPGKTIDRVVLTVAADDSMLSPMVIFKGKYLKLTAPEGVLVSVQIKAWMDEDLMTEYLEHIWQPYVEEIADKLGLPDHNALLTLDSFRAHTTDKITKAMEEHSTTHCVIPGGCTSKLQPLDVYVNKPLKQILKDCWANFIHTSVQHAADKTEKIDGFQAASTVLGGHGVAEDEGQKRADHQISSINWYYLLKSSCCS